MHSPTQTHAHARTHTPIRTHVQVFRQPTIVPYSAMFGAIVPQSTPSSPGGICPYEQHTPRVLCGGGEAGEAYQVPATVSGPDLGCAKQPVNDGSGREGEEEGGADGRAGQRSGMERSRGRYLGAVGGALSRSTSKPPKETGCMEPMLPEW
jgi:hypothetical protein